MGKHRKYGATRHRRIYEPRWALLRNGPNVVGTTESLGNTMGVLRVGKPLYGPSGRIHEALAEDPNSYLGFK